MTNFIVAIGAGLIGQAIARQVSASKHVLLADLRDDNLHAAAKVLSDAGFEVSTATVDVSSRESVHALVETATGIGAITGVIHAVGVSPAQASPAMIQPARSGCYPRFSWAESLGFDRSCIRTPLQ